MRYTLVIEDRHGRISDELSFARGSFSLGRNEANDVCLDSNTVSRRHARIFTDSGRCFIEDLNSTNGVMVDGRRIYGTAELVPGSQLRIGDFLLLLKLDREPSHVTPHPAQQIIPHVVPRTVPVSEAMHYPRLVRVGDALEGETFSLTEQHNTIGRTDDNFILLSDPSVSRRHATVYVEGQRYVIFDRGSSNGTLVNDQMALEPILLRPGDIVRLGNVAFVFAAPGQRVNLREYARRLGGESRGLMVAITILSLLLVLVASGIGIFLVLENRNAEGEGAQGGAAVSASERARELSREADDLAREKHWQEAMMRYRRALDFDSDLEDALVGLEASRSEFRASELIYVADRTIHSADRVEQAGNASEAVALYERARSQLLDIPSWSVYWDQANNRLTLLIDPALVSLYRELGESKLDSDPTGAAHDLQRALDIWSGLPEDRRPDVSDDIRSHLWSALVEAGNRAYDAEDYQQAVEYYERAQVFDGLPREEIRRLSRARSEL